jgi:hypothetical protein
MVDASRAETETKRTARHHADYILIMRTADFMRFVCKRYEIFERRKKRQAPPWTKDVILRDYRFCNVHRENDRVTRWIAEHWRDSRFDSNDVWFWMVIARLINRIEALEMLPPPGRKWHPESFAGMLHDHRNAGGKVFGAAYIVSTGGKQMDKVQYVADYVLAPLWANRVRLRPQAGQTLAEYNGLLRQYDGLGSFMAAQVVADIKYTAPLRSAKDWWTFACSGPGSRRGLNRVLNRDYKSQWNEDAWYMALHHLWVMTKPLFRVHRIPAVHMQDLQNCLCEFDKYERARLNQGRPKQNFIPAELKQLSLFGNDV